MSYLQTCNNKENELILNTPNRKEILKVGAPVQQTKDNLLGRGAYGTVIKAIYKSKPVALKIIKNVMVSNRNTMLNETNILGWVHPNIVRVFKIESTLNYAIVVMERFNGHCLQKVLDTIELPLLHRIFIALDILTGLMHCHKNNLLHMDIKPQNIMVSLKYPQPQQILKSNTPYRSYVCKLCDFGSSIKISKEYPQNKGSAKGTLRYMAPEVLKEQHLTPAADIFSLGITLWQMKYHTMPYQWLECNEVVAYQVVKHKLRPNACQSNFQCVNHDKLNSHDNCLCETNSNNLAYYSMESLSNILNKTKCELINDKLSITECPHITQVDKYRKPLKVLNHNTNRNIINKNNNNNKLNVKRNLQQDFILIDTFSLKSVFKDNNFFNDTPYKEQMYEEIFKSCWHSDFKQRPKALDLIKRFKEFL